MKKLLVIAALLSTTSAFAGTCQTLEVTVLPFTVTEDFTKTFPELQAEVLRGSDLGAVVAEATAKLEHTATGCKATIGYLPATMYIARNLKSNQCAFQHVLHHENHHVEIYNQALSKMQDSITSSFHGNQDDKEVFQSLVHELDVVKEQHQSFDSPEEYAENSTACGGVIPGIIRRSKQ